MDVRYFLVLLMLLVSCMPQPQVSQSNLAGSTPNTTSGSSSGSNTTVTTETTWNYLGSTSKNITINVSNLNNAYIVGTPIENFLGTLVNSAYINFSGIDYCMISRYSLGGTPLELRSRIVPISYYDFTSKRTVRILRVDFQDVTNSTSFCNLPLYAQDSNGNFQLEVPPTFYFDPALLCPTCTSLITSNKVRVFKRNATLGRLEELPLSQVNVTALNVAVDPNNSASSNQSTCSSADCRMKGFDCCLENQCVKDGATRPSAQTQYASQLRSAEQERLQNPLAYLNYPNLYYICSSSVPSSGSSSSSSNPSYDAAFEQVKKDYYCLELIKSQAPSKPFHSDILNTGLSFTGNADCKTAPADAGQTMYIQEVLKRLYQKCGCAKTTLSDMVSSCPAYEYTVVLKDAQNVPTKIDCYTPPSSSQNIPLQQSVTVNSRTAPHRFFDSNGVERDITSGRTSYTQEGDSFQYVDNGKLMPSQQPFSMNAILGSMSVLLDQALPAKTVNVELDQVYMLSTTSGYYTACPTCSKDSWLPSFSPFPTTANGAGLQHIGHTTERDAFSTNTTGGNYEDTIFGRACWLPPTMVPFSHTSQVGTQNQRLNRLKTQAALYANGYQRDWFGFNKGAMIGSFDGVTWFAIGKGRIVKATSKKLFLAINAPFADLASPTLHVVNVQAYDGITQAAQMDYDPQYNLSHAYQNEAGTCQANHFCSTDTDCITRLGWEYVCADIRNLKTQWPTFDASGDEVSSQSRTATIDQILQQKRLPSSTTMRCVYRGAGAPCINNSSAITDLTRKKLMTCAPNFYCAPVNTANVFNSKVARYGGNLQDVPVLKNHLYGKDANVLGRPLNYVAGSDSTSLPAQVSATIVSNLVANDSLGTSSSGICQPGKALPTSANEATLMNPFEQHKTADTSKRTDFISQIGSCNSGLFDSYRHSSCPVIGSDGNYEMFSSTFSLTGYNDRARNQNACGLETIYNGVSLALTPDSLSAYSPLRNVESKTLPNQTIVQPTFARDACMRRAGQVCQTDLDCSPNKYHASQTDLFTTLAYWGNEAEKNYYNEYLVCGQTDPKPIPSDGDAFKNYNMSLNRCCREVGKTITTYTSDVPTTVLATTYDPATLRLLVAAKPGGAYTSDSRRYSRLATVENLNTADRPVLTAFQEHNGGAGLIANPIYPGSNVMTPYQWKTLGEANSETCCGGGWIRKFADGTNDWTRTDRVYMDVTKFACINSRTPLLTVPTDAVTPPTNLYSSSQDVQNLVNNDYHEYCQDPLAKNGSCAQYSIGSSLVETPPSGDPLVPTGAWTGDYFKTYGMDFAKFPDLYFYPLSTDNDPAIFIDLSISNGRRNISVKLPSYIPRSAFDNFYSCFADGDTFPTQAPCTGGETRVEMFDVDDEAGTVQVCAKKNTVANITDPKTSDTDAGHVNAYCDTTGNLAACCWHFDSTSRTLKVVPDSGDAPAAHFDAMKTAKSGKLAIRIINAYTAMTPNRKKPGSDYYYLKRLGLFELSGIPQITFAPLYCSDNSDRVVPGLFSSSITTKTAFESSNFAFNSGETDLLGTTIWRTNYKGLATDPVFSASEFKCCTPLGKTTKDVTKCCSGHGVSQGSNSTTFTCALPTGADLMVYFNRFVSNEGRGTDQPGGGLVDADFDSKTGEPLGSKDVGAKITALGGAYCESGKVRQGGAFGAFAGQPLGIHSTGAQIYNIVDSPDDHGQLSNGGQTSEVGYQAFMQGFRWNHHLYCN